MIWAARDADCRIEDWLLKEIMKPRLLFALPLRRFWLVVVFVGMVVAAGWYAVGWSQRFVVTWHDPAVRVKFAGIRYGANRTGPYPVGWKGRVNQMLFAVGLRPRVKTFPPTRGLSGSYDTVWFELSPKEGMLVPDGDVVTFTRADGRKVSFGQARGESVNKGEIYLMAAQIDEGVDAVKEGTLELVVAGRKRAVIRIR
jgi:hypothetical protein